MGRPKGYPERYHAGRLEVKQNINDPPVLDQCKFNIRGRKSDQALSNHIHCILIK